ncbi:MAG: leucine-rich repeat protein [Mycoplasmoidaceae bacterium]
MKSFKRTILPIILTIGGTVGTFSIVSCGNKETTYTISWTTDSQYGRIDEDFPVATITKNTKWSKIPKPKIYANSGYRLAYWEDDQGKKIDDDYVFSHSFAANAVFEAIPFQDQITINFTCDTHCHFVENDDPSHTYVVTKGSKWADILWICPEIEVYDGYDLLGCARRDEKIPSPYISYYLTNNTIFKDGANKTVNIQFTCAYEGTKLIAFNANPEGCEVYENLFTTFTSEEIDWEEINKPWEIVTDRGLTFNSQWKDETGKIMENGDKITKSIFFDPVLQPSVTHKISFKVEGNGSLSKNDPIVAFDQDKVSDIMSALPETIAETGHVFEGWFIDDDSQIDPDMRIDTDLTFIAKFKKNKRIKIWLDTDGLENMCTFDLKKSDFTEVWYGTKWKEIKYLAPKFYAKPGYKFSHWEVFDYISQDPKWIPLNNDWSFTGESESKHGNWNRIRPQFDNLGKFNIQFSVLDQAHGTLAGEKEIKNVNNATRWTGLKDKTPVPVADDGYLFAGWYISNGGNYTKLNDNSSMVYTRDETLEIYAKFIPYTDPDIFSISKDDYAQTCEIIGINGVYSTIETIAVPKQIEKDETIYTVTSIHDLAFANCPSLTSFYFDNNITKIGKHIFHRNANITEIGLPYSISNDLTIGSNFIPDSYSASCLSWPLTQTDVNPNAGLYISDEYGPFSNAIQDAFIIPKNLKSIGKITPAQSKLNLLIIDQPELLTEPMLSSSAFDNIGRTGTVLIPSSIEDTYNFIETLIFVWPTLANWTFYSMDME